MCLCVPMRVPIRLREAKAHNHPPYLESKGDPQTSIRRILASLILKLNKNVEFLDIHDPQLCLFYPPIHLVHSSEQQAAKRLAKKDKLTEAEKIVPREQQRVSKAK